MKSDTRKPAEGLRGVLDVVASVSIVIVAGLWAWTTFANAETPPPPRGIVLPTQPLSFAGAASLGSVTAPVVLIAFSDFECPFCARFARDTVPGLKAQYVDTGRVQLVFKHYPLRIHASARRAAEAAECARQQGAFWPMHDILFSEPLRLAEGDLMAAAASASVDLTTFTACMSDGGPRVVDQDIEQAKGMKITGTPTLLLGRRAGPDRVEVLQSLPGAVALKELSAAIDSIAGQ